MSIRDTAATTPKIPAESSSLAKSAASSVSSSASYAAAPRSESIIGHLKTDGHLGRCYLKGCAGDAAYLILSTVGHNFRRILAWLGGLWCLILTTHIAVTSDRSQLKSDS